MKKIFQLFLIMFMGILAVKVKILKTDDVSIISKIVLYIFGPCAIINCFQTEYTPELGRGLLLSLAAGLLFQIIIISVCTGAKKIFRLSKVEYASSIYSNSVNLLFPIVTSILGPEWLIYTAGYFTIQTFLFWSHLINTFSGEGFQIKKVLTNVNVIAVFAGLAMMFAGIRLPDLVGAPVAEVGGMIGPLSMFSIGMLMAKISLRQLLCSPKIYLVMAIRMLVCPAIILIVIKATGMTGLVENGKQILLISLLAAGAPTANMVAQFASLYDDEASYASAIGSLTLLSCIITMPLLVFLYGM